MDYIPGKITKVLPITLPCECTHKSDTPHPMHIVNIYMESQYNTISSLLQVHSLGFCVSVGPNWVDVDHSERSATEKMNGKDFNTKMESSDYELLSVWYPLVLLSA